MKSPMTIQAILRGAVILGGVGVGVVPLAVFKFVGEPKVPAGVERNFGRDNREPAKKLMGYLVKGLADGRPG